MEVFTRSLPYTVRVHSAIANENAWPQLWYCLRGLDDIGRGTLNINIELLKSLLNCGTSTIYQWLREGKKAAAFRSYSIRRGNLEVWLGSLHKVCIKLNIRDFGSVTLVPLSDVLGLVPLRANAAIGTLTALQKDSMFAAKCSLKEHERKRYRQPNLKTVFGRYPDRQPGNRASSGIIAVSQKKLFVAPNFIPFGASQSRIAYEITKSERSVRRYIKLCGVPYKQICQYKPEYRELRNAILYESPYYETNGKGVNRMRDGSYSLFGDSTSTRIDGNRLFKYQGKTWLLRCNIYLSDHSLKSMKKSREVLASLMGKKNEPRPSPKGLDRG